MAICFAVLAVSALPVNAEMGVWRDINPDAYISPPANPQLNSIYMLSSSEGWAVGDYFHHLAREPRFPPYFIMMAQLGILSQHRNPGWFLLFCSICLQFNFGDVWSPNSPISKNDGWAVGFNDTYSDTTPLRFRLLGWDNVASAECRLSGVNAGTIVVCVHG